MRVRLEGIGRGWPEGGKAGSRLLREDVAGRWTQPGKEGGGVLGQLGLWIHSRLWGSCFPCHGHLLRGPPCLPSLHPWGGLARHTHRYFCSAVRTLFIRQEVKAPLFNKYLLRPALLSIPDLCVRTSSRRCYGLPVPGRPFIRKAHSMGSEKGLLCFSYFAFLQ